MGRLLVMVDQHVKVSPAELAAAWNNDEEARAAGTATVGAAPPGDFFGVLELVVIPLAVNLASAGITALLGRLIGERRPREPEQPEIEITEVTSADGDRVVAVKLRGKRS